MKTIVFGLSLIASTHIANTQLKGNVSAFSNTAQAAKVVEIENSQKEDSNATDTSGIDNNKSDTNRPASIKAYSKYDFVPGEKVLGFEDFSTGNIGDFPSGWNTNAAGEIVTIEGKPGRWLSITRAGVFIPGFTNKYPDDFTFEFDLLHGVPFGAGLFQFVMAELDNFENLDGWHTAPNVFKAGFYTAASGEKEGTSSTEIRKNSESQSANQFQSELLNDEHNPLHVSIWRQKERVRIYCNEEKLWDIPKAIAAGAKINALLFPIEAVEDNVRFYVSNLRLAVGAPDTRNKFVTQGKWVTHGILFGVNSANVKAESYGSLKEIATVLKENSGLKVKIVGHTDSDGNEVANLDLSKRRSAAVKGVLAKEFGIDEGRMETDGKGEGEPIDKNDTPAGKANNRRVEFIKL